MRKERALIVVMFLAAFGVVLLRNAWISDDAFITFRTIANFADGHGLTWNVGERVQVYTHPLWLLLLSAAFSYGGDLYLTTILLSVVISVLTVGLVAFGVSRSLAAGLLGIFILTLSKAFVDYSTSGLENPLTHLLLVLFYLALLRPSKERRHVLLLAAIAALGMLNRLDTALLFLPGLATVSWMACRPDDRHPGLRRRDAVQMVLLGFAPLILWELFSVFYYGFPFPNTAYAKLGNALGRGELIQQGLVYLRDSLSVDPLTLLVIAAGMTVPFFVRDWRVISLATGVALYLGYVVAIGGDFMSGRFLAAPLLGGVMLLSRSPFVSDRRRLIPAFGMVVLIGLISPHPPPLSGPDYGEDHAEQKRKVDRDGISDERAFYYAATGLLRAGRGASSPSYRHVWVDAALKARERGETVVVRDSVGFYGYHAGPGIHIIDRHGLGDALLARLPPVWRPRWRVGHFVRAIPEGYEETLASGNNRLADLELAAYYDALARIIRGPLFRWDRLAEIARMNLGLRDALIDTDRYRYPGMVRVDLAGAAGSGSARAALPPTGIRVQLTALSHAPRMEIALDGNRDYEVVHLREGTEIARFTLRAQPGAMGAVVSRQAGVPESAVRRGYDGIHLLPSTGAGEPRFGHLRLLE